VASNKALGKGLSALFGERLEGRLGEIPVDEITVSTRQPRRSFDEEELAELAESIRHLGIVQPVVVRPVEGQEPVLFELIAGERRLRAARMAGMARIPALVRPTDDVGSLQMALAENVARQDLNGIEEAHAFAALVDEFGLTHERIGELVGKSRVTVTNTLRLLELPDDVQAIVERGEISEGHARALLGLEAQDERRQVARTVVREGLTVRQTEALVRKLATAQPVKAAPAADHDAEAYFADLTDELYGVLQAPVRIRAAKRGGRLEITFKDRAELERLVQVLRSAKGGPTQST
jgi:ParB family transcriptional regulator, chromosome partitioning protein